MNRGGWLLIGLLFLMGASCTRRDWVGDMLVLTDTTGDVGSNVHIERSGQPHVLALTLRQSGTRVTGETSAAGAPTIRAVLEGSLEGIVHGEVFTFTLSSGVRGEVHLDGDEMSGSLVGPQFGPLFACPWPISLRRLGSAAPSQQAQ
jgi:hypothetical protein